MFRFFIVLAVVVGAVTLAAPSAFAGSGFGHGFAWVNDDDGDGIPNGRDTDWLRPRDGSGYKFRHGFAGASGHGPKAAAGSAFQYRSRQRQSGGICNPDCASPLRIRQHLRDGSCTR